MSGAATNSLSESQLSDTEPIFRMALPTIGLSNLRARVRSPNMISKRRWSKKRTAHSKIQIDSLSLRSLVQSGVVDETLRRPNPHPKFDYVASSVYVDMTHRLRDPAR